MNFGWRFNWNIGRMIGEADPLNQQPYEDLISHFGTLLSSEDLPAPQVQYT